MKIISVKTIFAIIAVSASLVSCSTVKKMNTDDWNKLIDLGQKIVQDARAMGADVNEVKAAIDEVKAREEAEAKDSAVTEPEAVIITGGK
ncbi:MAG: hypothetical protein MJZ17_05090 [Bacteroidales bacterium]|nr:hypothetical protein [Bacteroidales bacterium]